jgi:hypothetical protein
LFRPIALKNKKDFYYKNPQQNPIKLAKSLRIKLKSKT